MSDRATIPASGGAVRLALVALIVGALALAFSPIFVRLSETGPTATAFWRLGLALPALWLWMGVRQYGPGRIMRPARPTSRRDYVALAGAGLFFAGDLAIWHQSILLTSVANATLFSNFTPIFVTLAARILFGERFRPAFVGALALAIGGSVLIVGNSFSLGPGHVLGDALALITAVFYGGYILAVSRLRARFSTTTIMSWSGAVTAATLLPLTLIAGENLLAPTLHGWLVLAGLALISQIGGQGLVAYALAHLPVAFSSVGLLLQPVAAAVLAWILFAETLGPLQAAGGAAVLAGIVLARRASRAR